MDRRGGEGKGKMVCDVWAMPRALRRYKVSITYQVTLKCITYSEYFSIHGGVFGYYPRCYETVYNGEERVHGGEGFRIEGHVC